MATGAVFEGDPSKPLPTSEVNAAQLAGAWENTKLDSHMDTGRLGQCAPYQVDLGCGEDRSGAKRKSTFPFRRVR